MVTLPKPGQVTVGHDVPGESAAALTPGGRARPLMVASPVINLLWYVVDSGTLRPNGGK